MANDLCSSKDFRKSVPVTLVAIFNLPTTGSEVATMRLDMDEDYLFRRCRGEC